MNILIFPPYYPPHIGGVEAYAEAMNHELNSQGHVLTIFTPHLPNTTPTEEKIGTLSIIRFPAIEIISNYPIPKFWSYRYWDAFSKIKQSHFDTVVSHTRFFLTSFIALKYAQNRNLPLLHIEHGSSFVQSSNLFITYMAYLYDKTIGRYILQHATQVIAIAQAVSSFVKKRAPKAKVTTLYRGFSWELFDGFPVDMSLRKQYPRSFIIVSIGRLVSGKGMHDLVGALVPLQARDWHCFIVGDGPEKMNLTKQTKKFSLEKKITFLGEKSLADTHGILKACDLFISPSYSEGLPTTVIEASYHQKAIIATDIGGTNEIIQDGESGFLIPVHMPTKITEKIISLMDSPDMRLQLGMKAQQRVVRLFSWKNTIAKLQSILNIDVS